MGFHIFHNFHSSLQAGHVLASKVVPTIGEPVQLVEVGGGVTPHTLHVPGGVSKARKASQEICCLFVYLVAAM